MRAVQPMERAPSSSRRTMPNGSPCSSAVPDHPLVALLEDVQRHLLARKQHERAARRSEARRPAIPADSRSLTLGQSSGGRHRLRGGGAARGPRPGRRARRGSRCSRSSPTTGVPLEELKRAVDENRLVLLPVERVFEEGSERYTAAEIADSAGIENDFLVAPAASARGADPGDDERVYGEADLEAAKRAKLFVDAGLPDDGVLEISRIIGMLDGAPRRREPATGRRGVHGAGRRRAGAGPALRGGGEDDVAAARRDAAARLPNPPARGDPPAPSSTEAELAAGRAVRLRRGDDRVSRTWSASPGSGSRSRSSRSASSPAACSSSPQRRRARRSAW